MSLVNAIICFVKSIFKNIIDYYIIWVGVILLICDILILPYLFAPSQTLEFFGVTEVHYYTSNFKKTLFEASLDLRLIFLLVLIIATYLFVKWFKKWNINCFKE